MSKFVGIKTYERFRSLWENNDIDEFSLNFILDTGQLYTHGVFINSAVFGTAANGAVLLSIAGTTNTLALSSHTHSNYYNKNENLDITNHKIISGDNDLLFCSGGALYIGNIDNPTYISGSTIQSIKGLNTYTILDTENFSISNTLPTGYTHNNTAYIEYGGNSFLIDYVKRINTSLSFDYLNTYTLAGTNLLDGDYYGYINFTADNVYNNPAWALLRINIPNKSIQFRTSADANNWIGVTDNTAVKLGTAGAINITNGSVISTLSSNGIIFQGGTNSFKVGNGTNSISVSVSHGLSTKNITINGSTYALYTSASSLPTILAPTAYAGTGGQVLATNSNKNGLTWVSLPTKSSWNYDDVYTKKTLSIPVIVGSSKDTTAGTWTGTTDAFSSYVDGLTIIYIPAVAGASTTTLNINNLGAKTCYSTNTSKLTTHYSVGTPIMFTYYGGHWKRADYDSGNTKYYLKLNGTVHGSSGKTNLGTLWAPEELASTGGYILATNSEKTGLEWIAKPVSNVTTSAIIGSSATDTTLITDAQTNPYYNLIEGGSVTRSIRFVAGNGITISAGTDGQITITNSKPYIADDTNTWRPIKINGTEKRGTSITSGDLDFVNGSNISVEWTSDNKLKINAVNTWNAFTAATSEAAGTAGYIQAPAGAQNKFFRGDNTWLTINLNVTSALYIGASNGTGNSAQSTNGNVYLIFAEGSSYSRYKIVGSGRASVTSDASGNITINSSGYSNFGAATATAVGSAGLVPAPGANILGTGGYFLRADGSWAVPTNTWKAANNSQEGYVPKLNGNGTIATQSTEYVLTFTSKDTGTITPTWKLLPTNAFANTWTAWAGATNESNGTAGYLDAPGTENISKFLRGDGEWSDPYFAIEKLTDWATTTTTTASNIAFTKVWWKIAPTSSNRVYGIGIHPSNGQLYYIYNNKGIYTATAYSANTWRNIYTNGTSRVGTSTGTKAINFVQGNNITITYLAAGTSSGLSGSAKYFDIKIDATDTWNANAVGVAGYVAAPTKAANANMTWQTDAEGVPAWRASNNHSHSYLPLSGANYNTSTDTNPFTISRAGDTIEAMQVMVNDSRTLFKYTNDESASSIVFQLVNTDTESGGGEAASDRNVTISSNNTDISLFVGGTLVSLNGHKHVYTDLTGSGTTANLVILSNGTANGWKLATLGTRAFDSTNYLPLSGGTMTGDITFNYGESHTDQFINFKANDNIIYSFGIRRPANTYGLCFVNNGNYYKVWHEGNDGSGSGLDADTLDGVHNGRVTASKWWTTSHVDDWYERSDWDGTYFWLKAMSGSGSTLPNAVAYSSSSGNADKLTTARSIWGLSFDGTGDITGHFYLGGYLFMSFGGSWLSTIDNDGNGPIFGYALALNNKRVYYTGSPVYICGGSYSNYASGITVNSSNNVGVGTTSPSYKLDVYGVSRSKYMLFYNNAYNDNAGYVGAGSSSSNEIILEAYSGNALSLWANGTRTVYIDTSNNVGIGTASPSYKLHVSGNVGASNFYTTSDRLKKQNISSLSEHIRKFQMKDTKAWHYGVIALEVPEMFRLGEEGNMTVNYNSVLSYYVGQLENRVKELELEVLKLKMNNYDNTK